MHLVTSLHGSCGCLFVAAVVVAVVVADCAYDCCRCCRSFLLLSTLLVFAAVSSADVLLLQLSMLFPLLLPSNLHIDTDTVKS